MARRQRCLDVDLDLGISGCREAPRALQDQLRLSKVVFGDSCVGGRRMAEPVSHVDRKGTRETSRHRLVHGDRVDRGAACVSQLLFELRQPRVRERNFFPIFLSASQAPPKAQVAAAAVVGRRRV